jgi:transposase
MGYVEGVDRQQQVLFPEALDDYVAPENPVRVIEAFVRGLDMAELGFVRAMPASEGRPGFDPRDLLALFIYGYLNRTRSSRRLERETHRNLEVIWLMRKLQPDHKTISEFRRVHRKELKGVVREFTLLCKALDLFGESLVFIDGSKLRAVNNRDRNYSDPRLKKLLKRIDAHIQQYLAELDKTDAEEEGQSGATDSELREKLAALQERRELYTRYQQELKESGEKQLSLTDPESRRMKMRGGTDVCYNAQIAVDPKHHLIVAHDVTNEVTDIEQLGPMALAAKEALGVETLEVAADRGYHNGAHVVVCENNGITPYVPAPKTSKNDKKGLYTQEAFAYDPERDAYRCPSGEWLTHSTQTMVGEREIRYYANRAACSTCPKREKCTSSKDGRRISRAPEEAQVDAMRERLRGRAELMVQRKSTVEHPFGTIKWTWDGGHVLLQGLEKVGAELSLSVLAYNLRRVINIVGVECLLEALKRRKISPNPVPAAP